MRLRCCNRFGYWAVPLGPWRCSKCNRVLSWTAGMPRSGEPRFWDEIDAIIAAIPPLTFDDWTFIRRAFGFGVVLRGKVRP